MYAAFHYFLSTKSYTEHTLMNFIVINCISLSVLEKWGVQNINYFIAVNEKTTCINQVVFLL